MDNPLGKTVRIKATGQKGLVTGILLKLDGGTQYEVTFWAGSARAQIWIVRFEFDEMEETGAWDQVWGNT